MNGMIFSAGLGTRFKPWTDRHPKALAVVNGKTLLQRNIEYLQQHGITRVIVNVHHFASQVIEAIQAEKGWGSEVIISDERDQLLETGGGLLHAQSLFTAGQPFLTCNVDILTDLDISELIRFHDKHKALASFGVTQRETSRYLLFDKENRLCGWRNKKTGEEKISRREDELVEKAYSCVVIFDYAIFHLMEQARFTGKFSLIDVYLELAADHLMMGFDHTGDRFVDVGKPETVEVAAALFP